MGLSARDLAAPNSPAAELEPAADLEELQRRLGEVRKRFEGRIRAAREVQDGIELEIATRELQDEISRQLQAFQNHLAASPSAQVLKVVGVGEGAEPARERLYDASLCSIDLDDTVYDGDRDALAALLRDSRFVIAADEVLKEDPVFSERRQLLKRCMRLSRAMAPTLYAIGDRCRDALGLKAGLDFYVHQDSRFDVAYYPPGDDRMCLLVTSALLERFGPDELAFAIGHEIGHALFDHHRLPINVLLEKAGHLLSPIHAMSVYAWKRSAELSADRVGYACGRNFEAAAQALFKLSSGITEGPLDFQVHEYMDQFRELERELMAPNGPRCDDAEDWYSTQPFSPIRLRALELFSKHAVGEMSRAAMESEIRRFMALMEPSYLNWEEGGELAGVSREFVFMGSYAIQAANGIVDPRALEGISSLLDPESKQLGLDKVEGVGEEAMWDALREAAHELTLRLPPVTRLGLIKDLTIIAYADGNVTPVEVDTLYRLSALLRVHPQFVDRILHSAGNGLD